MFGFDLAANILQVLDNKHPCGIDTKKIQETLDVVNLKLENIGIKIFYQGTGKGLIERDKTIITSADVVLFFFDPEEPPECIFKVIREKDIPNEMSFYKQFGFGLEVNKLKERTKKASEILNDMGIFLCDDFSQSKILYILDNPKIIHANTSIYFSKTGD